MRVLALALLLALSPEPPSPTAGHVPEPFPETIRFAVTEIVGLEHLQSEWGAFAAAIEQACGMKIEFYPVTNRAAAAEGLKFKRVDFVLTGPAEYVVMKKRSDARPVVGFSRPDYFSAVIVLADSPYQTAKDLAGKKVAFATVGSTSGHLGPMQLIADAGVDPAQYEPLHLLTPVAFEALKRGDVAAMGLGAEKFAKLRDEDAKKGGPQPGHYRVILRGRDLPHDVLLAGAHVAEDCVAKVRKAFVEQSDALIQGILQGADNKKRYGGMKFIPTVRDQDYDYVRSMYKTAGYPEYSEFLEK
ncbi:MAG: PhnD/SsuA/transferrin family substrate-binding protein [Planctomycetes bacterium]|nr:PhnD/SsuA/transferrin family substrate-binding protein [Planctomycetota bacterium]